MASQKTDFFQKDTPHGYIKRLMYKKYLQAFIAKTQTEKDKYNFRTVIIDGFAGAGRYGNEWPDDIESYGSPLIAVMVALQFFSRKAGEENIVFGWPPSDMGPEDELEMVMNEMKIEDVSSISPADVPIMDCDISLIFIENDSENYRKLKSNVQELLNYFLRRYFPDIEHSELRTDDAILFSLENELFSIQIAIFQRKFTEFDPPDQLYDRTTRSLTFLDPFGYSHMPMEHVSLFASERGNEVFINFMSSYVNRFVSKNVKAVCDLYGINDHYMKEKILQMLKCMAPDDAVVELVKRVIFSDKEERDGNYVQKFSETDEHFLKLRTGSEFALSFEVRGKGNTIIYHMIHITHHRNGLEAMKEAMNRCSQTEGQMKMSDFYIIRKGHKLNLGNCDDQNKVADVIFGQFNGRLSVDIDRVCDFVWFDTPYVYRKNPLQILQRDGRITHVQDIEGRLQKGKNTFPDHIKWMISFWGSCIPLQGDTADMFYPPAGKGRDLSVSHI